MVGYFTPGRHQEVSLVLWHTRAEATGDTHWRAMGEGRGAVKQHNIFVMFPAAGKLFLFISPVWLVVFPKDILRYGQTYKSFLGCLENHFSSSNIYPCCNKQTGCFYLCFVFYYVDAFVNKIVYKSFPLFPVMMKTSLAEPSSSVGNPPPCWHRL